MLYMVYVFVYIGNFDKQRQFNTIISKSIPSQNIQLNTNLKRLKSKSKSHQESNSINYNSNISTEYI